MKWTILAACLAAAPAAASPCGDRIAALEQRFESTTGDAAAAKPDLQGTAPETTGALLHHQPTVGSVEGAEKSADSPEAVKRAKFEVYIEQARAADNASDPKECEASLREAEKAMR